MAAKSTAQTAEAREKQRRASIDDLLAKKPLTKVARIQSGDEVLEVEFRSIGRKAYADLVEKHTHNVEAEKTDDRGNIVKDKKGEVVYEKQDQLDTEAFLPELISASAVDPEISVDQAKMFYDTWNSPEFDELAMAAWTVNTSNKVEKQGNA